MRRSTVLAGNPVKYDATARKSVVRPRIGAAGLKRRPCRYFGVQFFLEDQLGWPADLVTDKALRA
jgi:hypothetical protein